MYSWRNDICISVPRGEKAIIYTQEFLAIIAPRLISAKNTRGVSGVKEARNAFRQISRVIDVARREIVLEFPLGDRSSSRHAPSGVRITC